MLALQFCQLPLIPEQLLLLRLPSPLSLAQGLLPLAQLPLIHPAHPVPLLGQLEAVEDGALLLPLQRGAGGGELLDVGVVLALDPGHQLCVP
jgi:hypothetical protein